MRDFISLKQFLEKHPELDIKITDNGLKTSEIEFTERDLKDAFEWGVQYAYTTYANRIKMLFLKDIDERTDRKEEANAFESLLHAKRFER